jgi:TolB-like protein
MRLMTWAPLAGVAGVILAAGCAGGPPPGPPAPANLPALESEYSRNPRDADLATRVGIAYYDAKQYERARDVLRSALTLGEQNYPARVYLGLTYEELGQLDSARAQYTKAESQTSDSRRKAEMQDRLVLLTQKELRAAAKEAIAHEATLSTQPAVENAVAVFPFRYVGTTPDLAPVGRGLTHLMITDLGKISQLRLLEREQVQALVDELALTDAGRVDPSTGARSGRLLRAARVLQGSVEDVPARGQIRLDAAMVNTTNASIVASGSASDQLQQLFTLEKSVLLRLVDQMGIALSPAEQRALSERPTADLQAFLAFSRGLEAEDRGDWRAAEANFSAAVARDPNFRAAKAKQQVAQRIASTVQVPATQLAGVSEEPAGRTEQPAAPSNRWSVLRDGVLNTVPSAGSTVVSRLGPAPVSRVPGTPTSLPEATGTDGPGGGLFGTIVIIITRP